MNQMNDYFELALMPEDVKGIRPDIAELINTDIDNYKLHMIK